MAGKKGCKMYRYTPEQAAFLMKHIPGRRHEEIAALFNARFFAGLTAAQVKSFCSNRRVQTGLDARFKPGQTPFNKGKRGVNGCSSTSFKKGNRPQTWRPVGSERVNREGRIEIKVAEPRTWRPKQRVIWEGLHGPVPHGHVVLFADRNPRNFAAENLIAVSRGELAILNKFQLIKADTDLTKTGIAVASLMLVVSKRSKQTKKQREARA